MNHYLTKPLLALTLSFSSFAFAQQKTNSIIIGIKTGGWVAQRTIIEELKNEDSVADYKNNATETVVTDKSDYFHAKWPENMSEEESWTSPLVESGWDFRNNSNKCGNNHSRGDVCYLESNLEVVEKKTSKLEIEKLLNSNHDQYIVKYFISHGMPSKVTRYGWGDEGSTTEHLSNTESYVWTAPNWKTRDQSKSTCPEGSTEEVVINEIGHKSELRLRICTAPLEDLLEELNE